jgi:hypothetical protein
MEAQIGRNVKAYIDDIVMKSKKQEDLLDDLKETFDNLHKYKMMLNLKKCMFSVSSRKLLGYKISSRGSMRTRRRWRPSNNCSHLRPGKKSRSWQA